MHICANAWRNASRRGTKILHHHLATDVCSPFPTRCGTHRSSSHFYRKRKKTWQGSRAQTGQANQKKTKKAKRTGPDAKMRWNQQKRKQFKKPHLSCQVAALRPIKKKKKENTPLPSATFNLLIPLPPSYSARKCVSDIDLSTRPFLLYSILLAYRWSLYLFIFCQKKPALQPPVNEKCSEAQLPWHH